MSRREDSILAPTLIIKVWYTPKPNREAQNKMWRLHGRHALTTSATSVAIISLYSSAMTVAIVSRLVAGDSVGAAGSTEPTSPSKPRPSARALTCAGSEILTARAAAATLPALA